MLSFRQNFPKWFGNYFCFEADPEIAKRLKSVISENDSYNTYVFETVLWDRADTLKFDVSSAGSRVSENGIEVQADSIDYVLKDNRIDFIKIDIEGAEHKDLEGAKATIKLQEPVLAICIYHKPAVFLIKACAQENINFTLDSIITDSLKRFCMRCQKLKK